MKSKKISTEINSIQKTQTDIIEKIDQILYLIPNIALDDVPLGKDEKHNKELKKVGKILSSERPVI